MQTSIWWVNEKASMRQEFSRLETQSSVFTRANRLTNMPQHVFKESWEKKVLLFVTGEQHCERREMRNGIDYRRKRMQVFGLLISCKQTCTDGQTWSSLQHHRPTHNLPQITTRLYDDRKLECPQHPTASESLPASVWLIIYRLIHNLWTLTLFWASKIRECHRKKTLEEKSLIVKQTSNLLLCSEIGCVCLSVNQR